MAETSIEWTDRVWNPTTGCDRVSPGCDHCYAMTMAKRLKGMGSAKYQTDGDPRTSGPGFGVATHPNSLNGPLRWRKPQRIFVNSMSDLFHDQVPDDYIARVWEVMAQCPQHTFQILTKRHGRMRSLLNSSTFNSPPLPNVWLGVSAENQQWADIRIPALLDTPAAVRFVSAEPLLGPIDLTDLGEARGTYDGPWLDWVIVGGESGAGARPMHPDWARSLRDQCVAAGVPFLFKQWGEYAPGVLDTGTRKGLVRRGWYPNYPSTEGNYETVSRVGKKAAGRELDGATWDQYPGGDA